MVVAWSELREWVVALGGTGVAVTIGRWVFNRKKRFEAIEGRLRLLESRVDTLEARESLAGQLKATHWQAKLDALGAMRRRLEKLRTEARSLGQLTVIDPGYSPSTVEARRLAEEERLFRSAATSLASQVATAVHTYSATTGCDLSILNRTKAAEEIALNLRRHTTHDSSGCSVTRWEVSDLKSAIDLAISRCVDLQDELENPLNTPPSA